MLLDISSVSCNTFMHPYAQAQPIIGQINSEEYLDVIADPSLNGAYDSKEMLRMVEAATACVSHSPSQRPRMGQVREVNI